MSNYQIGNCLEILRSLPAGRFQMCCTSPPYWGLRSYVADEDPAKRYEIGLERTPEQYVANMVEVFREVRRVLRDDGALWLNIGDSYAVGGNGGGGSLRSKRERGWEGKLRQRGWRGPPEGYKEKDLVGIPWMVAFALRADGWYLRRDVVWDKGNATEPPRTDRPSSSHEMVFLLSKSKHYECDGGGSTVWRITPDRRPGIHIAVMPAALAERCVLLATKEGDEVLDPFLGSGTVGMVAERNGRRWFGCELNPAYEPLIKQRTAQVGLFGRTGSEWWPA